jgi:hypothetical protein
MNVRPSEGLVVPVSVVHVMYFYSFVATSAFFFSQI